jgi:hypothetical protein
MDLQYPETRPFLDSTTACHSAMVSVYWCYADRSHEATAQDNGFPSLGVSETTRGARCTIGVVPRGGSPEHCERNVPASAAAQLFS